MAGTMQIETLIYLAKCKNGHVVTVECTKYNVSSTLLHGTYLRCGCGATGFAKRLNVTHKEERACDRRCTNATGHDCECSCGGKNHGGDRSY